MSSQSNFRTTHSQPPNPSRRATLYPHDNSSPPHTGPIHSSTQPTAEAGASRPRQSIIVPPRPHSQPAQSRVQRATRGNAASEQPVRGKARGFGTPIIPLRYRKTPPNPVRSYETAPTSLIPMRPPYSSANPTPDYGMSSPLHVQEPMRPASNPPPAHMHSGYSLRPDPTTIPWSSHKRSYEPVTGSTPTPKRVRGTWQELAARYSQPPEDHSTRLSRESTEALLLGRRNQESYPMSQKGTESEICHESESAADHNSTTNYISSVWRKQDDLKSENSQSTLYNSQRGLSTQPAKAAYRNGFTETDNPTNKKVPIQADVSNTRGKSAQADIAIKTDKSTQTNPTSIADRLSQYCHASPHDTHDGLKAPARESNSSPQDKETAKPKLNIDVEFAKSTDLDTLITTRLRTGDPNVIETLNVEIILNLLYQEENDNIRDDVLKMFR
ncbi:hypothetical protein GGR57DRAFT_501782 [Xylariaceae sp. FL1272]|nr:hypothetical protein GGR57DRAFT_501782 [Xylariaceae sp. FL1272]